MKTYTYRHCNHKPTSDATEVCYTCTQAAKHKARPSRIKGFGVVDCQKRTIQLTKEGAARGQWLQSDLRTEAFLPNGLYTCSYNGHTTLVHLYDADYCAELQ
jgi:hypothetical protein